MASNDQVLATLDKILETLNGNGKPGLKSDLVTVQGNVSHIRSDVDCIKAERAEEARERERGYKERDAERRKFYYTVAGLFLGEAITLVVAISSLVPK